MKHTNQAQRTKWSQSLTVVRHRPSRPVGKATRIVLLLSLLTGLLTLSTPDVRADPAVDLYVNPDPAPAGVNQTWPMLGKEGIVSGIEELAAGETIVLTYGDAYMWPSRTTSALSSFSRDMMPCAGTSKYENDVKRYLLQSE